MAIEVKKVEFDVPAEWRQQWPCSRLAGTHVSITYHDGDTVALTVDGESAPDDLEGAELDAAEDTYAQVKLSEPF